MVGCHKRLICYQDSTHNQKSQVGMIPGAKTRNTIGMDRFPCNSKLDVIVISRIKPGGSGPPRQSVAIFLHHAIQHKTYKNVNMPEADFEYIRKYVFSSHPLSLPKSRSVGHSSLASKFMMHGAGWVRSSGNSTTKQNSADVGMPKLGIQMAIQNTTPVHIAGFAAAHTSLRVDFSFSSILCSWSMPRFFIEVTRNRIGPTWVHPLLQPIHPPSGDDEALHLNVRSP